jgi:hypothetical protein
MVPTHPPVTLPPTLYTNIRRKSKLLTVPDAIILILLSLLITAAVAYLPNHLIVISNRLWYYVHGEFLINSNSKVDVTAPQRELLEAFVESTKSVVSMTGRLKPTGMIAGRGDEL